MPASTAGSGPWMHENPWMTDRLTLTRPDDWHLHLRDGAAMAAVLPHTARQFARAIVMPNLKPPVTYQTMTGRSSSPACSSTPRRHYFGGAVTFSFTG